MMSQSSPTPDAPIKTSVHIRPKIGKNVFSCAAISAIVLLLILFAVVFAIAESGVLRVPFFSRFYTGPQPTRVVMAPAMTTDAFRILIGSRFRTDVLSGRSQFRSQNEN